MGTKEQPSVWDCHGDALPDEPLFTLLARDPQAPKLVRKWAHDRAESVGRGHAPITDAVKVAEAYELAQKMEVWRARRRESNPPMVEGEGRRSPVDSLEDIHTFSDSLEDTYVRPTTKAETHAAMYGSGKPD
jgi:hypothetical protein